MSSHVKSCAMHLYQRDRCIVLYCFNFFQLKILAIYTSGVRANNMHLFDLQSQIRANFVLVP